MDIKRKAALTVELVPFLFVAWAAGSLMDTYFAWTMIGVATVTLFAMLEDHPDKADK